jgi:hypothetical protein
MNPWPKSHPSCFCQRILSPGDDVWIYESGYLIQHIGKLFRRMSEFQAKAKEKTFHAKVLEDFIEGPAITPGFIQELLPD